MATSRPTPPPSSTTTTYDPPPRSGRLSRSSSSSRSPAAAPAPTGPTPSTGPGATASPAAAAGEAFADADWSEWTSTYTDVRPADEAALEELVKRTTALNESAWTAEVEPDWLQIAYTPEHVRVRLRGTGVDVHLDPRQIAGEVRPPHGV